MAQAPHNFARAASLLIWQFGGRVHDDGLQRDHRLAMGLDGGIFGYLDLSDHLHRAVGGLGHGGCGTTEQYSWVKCRRVATAVLCLVSAAVLDQLSTLAT